MTHLPSPEWRVSPDLTDYPPALADMEQPAAAIHAGKANERIWLLEHPPLYTASTSADPAELLAARFPAYDAGPGGRYTSPRPATTITSPSIDQPPRTANLRPTCPTLHRLGYHSTITPTRTATP